MTKAKQDSEEPTHWRNLASTAAQRCFLKALGLADVRGLTRGEASDMIEARKPGVPTPTPLDREMDSLLRLPYT